jgi:hypothetical protein
MIASPDKMPRRPSAQLTSMPWRVQAWARAPVAGMADIKIANSSARCLIISPLGVESPAMFNRRR